MQRKREKKGDTIERKDGSIVISWGPSRISKRGAYNARIHIKGDNKFYHITGYSSKEKLEKASKDLMKRLVDAKEAVKEEIDLTIERYLE